MVTCLPKNYYLRQLVLVGTLVHLILVISFCYKINNNTRLDVEALVGQYLLNRNNVSIFDFEKFKKFLDVVGVGCHLDVKLHPEVFELKELSLDKYFKRIGGKNLCFIDGTNVELSEKSGRCVCKMLNETSALYYGHDCGVPISIWLSCGKDVERFRRRSKPRRLIHALPLNHEFDLFETRMWMHYQVVDVFMVGESNRTNSGGTKDPFFLLRFSTGWLKDFQNKLLYIFQGEFPEEGYEDGVIADAFMRKHLTRSGFKRLKGYRPDDLFIYTDGDELIRPEIMTFLKIYDGYSEPIAFKYKWSIFGFFWTVLEDQFSQYKSPEPGGMSVKFFRDFYKFDSSFVRTRMFEENPTMLKKYASMNKSVDMFEIIHAGWHCSWCFKPEGIRKKLLDAPKSDYPRYGDDLAKTQLAYIKRIIKHGLYFNNDMMRGNQSELTLDEDPEMAPKFIINHRDRMEYLITNPYKEETIPRVHFKSNKTFV